MRRIATLDAGIVCSQSQAKAIDFIKKNAEEDNASA